MHNIAKVQPVDVAENFYAVLEEASIFRWALKNLGIAFDSAKSFLINAGFYLVSFMLMHDISLATFT